MLQAIDKLLKNSEIDFNKKWPIKEVIKNVSCPEPFNLVKFPSDIYKRFESKLPHF